MKQHLEKQIKQLKEDIIVFNDEDDIVCRSFWDIVFKLKIKDKITLTQTCTFAKQIFVAEPNKDFIIKSLELSENKVAMLLKLSFLESANRYDFFKNTPLKKVYVKELICIQNEQKNLKILELLLMLGMFGKNDIIERQLLIGFYK